MLVGDRVSDTLPVNLGMPDGVVNTRVDFQRQANLECGITNHMSHNDSTKNAHLCSSALTAVYELPSVFNP